MNGKIENTVELYYLREESLDDLVGAARELLKSCNLKTIDELKRKVKAFDEVNKEIDCLWKNILEKKPSYAQVLSMELQ